MDFGEFDQEALDFTRCVRPDGSAYGTAGTCRKGVEEELKKLDKKAAELRWNHSGAEKERMLSKINARKRQLKKQEQDDNYKTPEVDYDAAALGPNAYKAQLKLALSKDEQMQKGYKMLSRADKQIKEAKARLKEYQAEADKAVRKTKVEAVEAEVRKAEENYGKVADLINTRTGQVRKKFDHRVARSRALKEVVNRHRGEILPNRPKKAATKPQVNKGSTIGTEEEYKRTYGKNKSFWS